MILGFCREVNKNCAVLGYYAASIGKKRGPLPGPETSVRNYHSFIHSFSILSDDRSKASSKTMPPHSAI